MYPKVCALRSVTFSVDNGIVCSTVVLTGKCSGWPHSQVGGNSMEAKLGVLMVTPRHKLTLQFPIVLLVWLTIISHMT